MSDYLAYLANCALRGIEFTNETRDGKQWTIRNLMHISVGGFDLELHQAAPLPANLFTLAGSCIHTTDLFVRDVTEEELPGLREVIGYVCELLSFATESRVLPYGNEYPVGSGLGVRTSMVGTIQIWRPPFAQPEDTKKYVELCYDSFVRLRGRRMLHVAIDYIHHSIMKGLAREVQIGLACIAFETLRHNWARDTGYRFSEGFFREKSAGPSNARKVVSLKRHLAEMFEEVDMDADSERIANIRNEVLHTGLRADPQNEDTHGFLETVLRALTSFKAS
jgi:hypothetical protein